MVDCALELGKAGKASPRTCAVCGLGPCQRVQESPWYRNAAHLAALIAEKVFPHNLDRQRRDELTVLLAGFAAEIKRSAIEP